MNCLLVIVGYSPPPLAKEPSIILIEGILTIVANVFRAILPINMMELASTHDLPNKHLPRQPWSVNHSTRLAKSTFIDKAKGIDVMPGAKRMIYQFSSHRFVIHQKMIHTCDSPMSVSACSTPPSPPLVFFMAPNWCPWSLRRRRFKEVELHGAPNTEGRGGFMEDQAAVANRHHSPFVVKSGIGLAVMNHDFWPVFSTIIL